MIEKTLKITNERLAPAGAAIVAERRVPHERAPLARALKEVLASGAELAIIFGASAIADRRDVIPAALETVGGRIEHFGMPVDPGNLLLIGTAGEHPVLGAPGCARSPKENGFDCQFSGAAPKTAMGRLRGDEREATEPAERWKRASGRPFSSIHRNDLVALVVDH